MRSQNTAVLALGAGAILALSACSGGGLFGGGQSATATALSRTGTVDSVNDEDVFRENREQRGNQDAFSSDPQEGIFDLFGSGDDPNVTLEVNRYLWAATLDVLDFLPIETADPFTGIIVYGFGTPPGGSRSYRATVFIQDPAMDARSLRVSLSTRSGAAPLETVRAVEDAILTRARQLRIADEAL